MKIGPYTLMRELGHGGMAQIILANRILDDGTRMPCVVKLPRKSTAIDPGALRQLEEEAKIAIKLRHNNIVRVFDTGIHERLPYLVMDYIAGLDLQELNDEMIKAGLRWDVDTAMHVVREINHALIYTHGMTIDRQPQHIIHRDIATKNIMISGAGGVLLADFGVATSVSTNTTRHHVKGTLAYMAPEHYANQACPASDAFGLGAILWELLAGRLFRSDIPGEELTAAVVAGVIPDMGRDDLPREVVETLEGLLHPDPDKRMRLQALGPRLRKYPCGRGLLGQLIAHVTGTGIQPSGCSQAHFAASAELLQTFAVVKAAGLTPSEFRSRPAGVPIQPRNIAPDFEPEEVPTTADRGPPPRDDGVDDFDDAASAVPPTLIEARGGKTEPRKSKPAPTVRMSAGLGSGAVASRGSTDRIPPPSARSWSASPPLVQTGPQQPHETDAHALATRLGSESRRRPLIVAAVSLSIAAVLGIGFAVGGDTPAGDQDSIEVASNGADDSRSALVDVAASEPEPTRVQRIVQEPTDLELVDDVEVQIATPPPVVDPADEIIEEKTTVPTTAIVVDDPTPNPEKRKRKAKTPMVRLVVKRGFVDHAEIRIGGGAAKIVPGRGALNLKLRSGRRRVQWRTEPNGKWRSMFHDFEADKDHLGLVGGGIPRFDANPKGARSR